MEKICGIICEYNPFHLGHAWHIERAKTESGARAVICAMSGSFVQRGDAALIDKWSRAAMAAMCGADIVIELPTLYAVREAEGFALGGVSLLNALKCITHLSFGAETTDLTMMHNVAQVLSDEPKELSARIKSNLAAGMSFPRARADALNALYGFSLTALSAPNTILAIEYLRALSVMNSAIEPIPIQRTNDYKSTALGLVSSATAIREAIDRGDLSGALNATPEDARHILAGRIPGACSDTRALDAILLNILRYLPIPSGNTEQEDLMRRIIRASYTAPDRASLITAVKCKRFTYARISRVLTHVLLNITLPLIKRYPAATYARVLAVKKSALPLLAYVAKRSSIPVLTTGAQINKHRSPCLDLDLAATDMQHLCMQSPLMRASGQDFTQPMVIIE